MFSGDIKVFPRITQNMPKEANTDLYRAKYGMPLSKESHERFIATKVPDRKNKDYRARFRNFSFGFPVINNINLQYNIIDLQKGQLHAPLAQLRRYSEDLRCSCHKVHQNLCDLLFVGIFLPFFWWLQRRYDSDKRA